MFNRVPSFFKTLLPEQSAHLLLLAGLYALLVAVPTPWVRDSRGTLEGMLFDNYPPLPLEYRLFDFARRILLVTAFAAALPVVFLPITNAARKLVSWTLLPALLAIVQFIASLKFLPNLELAAVPPFHQRQSDWDRHLAFLLSHSGLVVALVGIGLIAYCIWGVAQGQIRMPIRFQGNISVEPAPGNSTPIIRRVLLFITVWLLWRLIAGPFFSWVLGSPGSMEDSAWYARARTLSQILGTITFVALFTLYFWLLRTGWKEMGNLFRPGRLSDYGLAFGAIAFIVVVPRVLFYLQADFAAYLGKLQYPERDEILKSLLSSDLFRPDSAFPIVAAVLPMELLIRGLLQPRLTSVHGLRRGIFLTCVVCTLMEGTPTLFGLTDLNYLLHTIGRTLAIGVLLAWMFQCSGSILPASLAHWFFWLTLASFWSLHISGSGLFSNLPFLILELVCVALTAYWLFKRFPPRPPLPGPALFPTPATSP